jgi:MipA family protein
VRIFVKSCSVNSVKFAFILGSVLSSALPTHAQQNADAEPQKDWQITLGAVVLVDPDYFGAKKSDVLPFPVIDIVWKERIFLSSTQGLGVYAINDKDTGFALGLAVAPGHSRSVSLLQPRLRGLGRISLPVQGRIFTSFSPTELISLSASASKDFGGINGYEANIGVNVGAPIGDKLSVGASVDATYYDRKTKQGLLGVTAAQSAATGFRVYTPKAGLHSVSFGLNARYALTDHFGAIVFVNADRLLGSSARSPIVERKWDRSAGVGLTYTF